MTLENKLKKIAAISIVGLSTLLGWKAGEYIADKSYDSLMENKNCPYDYSSKDWNTRGTGYLFYGLIFSALALGISAAAVSKHSQEENTSRNPEQDNGGDGPFGPGGSRY